MVKITTTGDFSKTRGYLNKMRHARFMDKISNYAQMGTDALASATPIDSGLTAESWYSEIEESKDSLTIYWKNSNINDGVPIAIILEFGHGTGTGGYVAGRDYITPAVTPVFERIAELIKEEVQK